LAQQSAQLFTGISAKLNNEGIAGFIKNEDQVKSIEGGKVKDVYFTFFSSDVK